MMAPVVINAENLSKRYRIGLKDEMHDNVVGEAIDLLISPIKNFRKLRNLYSFSNSDRNGEDVIWAVRDVSFRVTQGEVVGIIGRNGVGKTTLLRLLSGITDPTGGKAEIFGRVGALLAVGTGFHQELTGRENIYLNGTILGMRKREIDKNFDEIVDFSGVEKFIDTPVKRYSSGMLVRLGFAVAAHLEPEILMIDEVLAVGDIEFQQKCLGKMGEVARGGRTVLFVSHNMESIMGLCERTIHIDEGRIVADGQTEEVVRNYLTSTYKQIEEVSLSDRLDRKGNGKIRFTHFHLKNSDGSIIPSVMTGQDVSIVFSYVSREEKLRNVDFGFWIVENRGKRLINFNNRLTNYVFSELPFSGKIVCRIPHFPLRPGTYTIDINAKVNKQPADQIKDAVRLDVVPGDFYGTGRPIHHQAVFFYDHSWDVEP
ncbi:MAG: ABC transporter ATP-binding protein [Deltaproteobacteria bacterium]|nr:ABC transporter ATP-binding protein [Candidatus Zymogenaceae bacterium]